MYLPADAQLQPVRNGTLPQHDSLQLVPPELLVAVQPSGRDEHGRRHVVFLQQWFGVQQVVGVTVVEGHDQRAGRHTTLACGVGQLAKVDRPLLRANDGEVFVEMLWRDGQFPRVATRVADPVVQQDERPRREACA